MAGLRLSTGTRAAVALAALVLSACDPYIFSINNRTDQTVIAVLIYEERTQDKGMQQLAPGEGRTVGAVEFKDSRIVRVEAYDLNGEMIYCQRYSRPASERNATYPPDAPELQTYNITAGHITCEPFRPFVMPTLRPTPRPTIPRSPTASN